jgi:anti-anti-sigma factor
MRDRCRVTLTVIGEIDMVTGDHFRTAMDSAVDAAVLAAVAAEPAAVVIDLDRVAFMDSTGIAALVHAHSRAEEHRVDLTVANCGPQVQRVLEITGVAKLLTGDDPGRG